MSLPNIKSHERIVGKSCVVEILGKGYFRVISENGKGYVVSCRPNQEVHLGDVGWTIVISRQFSGLVRFAEDPSVTFNFAQAKRLYPHGWKIGWPCKEEQADENGEDDVDENTVSEDSTPNEASEADVDTQ